MTLRSWESTCKNVRLAVQYLPSRDTLNRCASDLPCHQLVSSALQRAAAQSALSKLNDKAKVSRIFSPSEICLGVFSVCVITTDVSVLLGLFFHQSGVEGERDVVFPAAGSCHLWIYNLDLKLD